MFCQQLIPFVDSHFYFNIYFASYWVGKKKRAENEVGGREIKRKERRRKERRKKEEKRKFKTLHPSKGILLLRLSKSFKNKTGSPILLPLITQN